MVSFHPELIRCPAPLQQYTYEGGTSPAESQHSVESNWSTPSSSSASSQQLSRDFLVGPTSQYSQNALPTRTTYQAHYPAYQGQHRLGLEHVRYGEHPSNTGGSYYRTPPQGYPIDGLLSHEIFEDAGAPINPSSQMNHPATSSQGSSSSSAILGTNQLPNVSTFSVSSASPIDSTSSSFPDAGPYLRQQLGISANEVVSLQSLPDPPAGEKPSTPLPMLIKLAIYGSPNKQLTLQEIYTELENRFQWFREHKHDKAWKVRLLLLVACFRLTASYPWHEQNSIRHNLSLNKVFQHVPRPITEPGKGNYWQLDVSGGEGYKRPRKRRPKNRMLASEEEEEEASEIDDDRPSPMDPTRLGRSSSTPVEDANIDPGLRSEGHVVGEGRTRSATRRAGAGSPYPSQSPRYQQGPLPVIAGQDGSVAGQPAALFGQPSFGQSGFPAYPQTRPMPVATSSTSFAALSSSSVAMGPTTSTVARPQFQYVGSYDRTAPVPQPAPRSGIEYIMEPGGLPAARRVKTFPEGQGQSQDDAARSSPDSTSSGSSRTWNPARSGSERQG